MSPSPNFDLLNSKTIKKLKIKLKLKINQKINYY